MQGEDYSREVETTCKGRLLSTRFRKGRLFSSWFKPHARTDYSRQGKTTFKGHTTLGTGEGSHETTRYDNCEVDSHTWYPSNSQLSSEFMTSSPREERMLRSVIIHYRPPHPLFSLPASCHPSPPLSPDVFRLAGEIMFILSLVSILSHAKKILIYNSMRDILVSHLLMSSSSSSSSESVKSH